MLGRGTSRSRRPRRSPHGAWSFARKRGVRGIPLTRHRDGGDRSRAEGSTDTLSILARITIALLVGYVTWLVSRVVAHATPLDDDFISLAGFVVGAIVGYAAAPQIGRAFERVASVVEFGFGGLSAYEALAGAVGLLIGLIVA